MKTRGILLPWLFASACFYQPDLSSVHYTCTAESPQCPEGLECFRGFCELPGAADNAPAPTEATSPLDGVPWILPSPQAFVPACKSTIGYAIDSSMAACPGTFPSGHPETLCGPNFGECRQISAAALATCNAAPGFFASFVEARGKTAGEASCDLSVIRGPKIFLMGCGTPAPGNPVHLVSPGASGTCAGFKNGIDCDDPQDGWSCGVPNNSTQQGYRYSANDRAENGVLCCRL